MTITKEWFEVNLLPRMGKCPNCGVSEWTPYEEVLPLHYPSYDETRKSADLGVQRFLLLVPVGCRRCGFTEFFNAHRDGLL